MRARHRGLHRGWGSEFRMWKKEERLVNLTKDGQGEPRRP